MTWQSDAATEIYEAFIAAPNAIVLPRDEAIERMAEIVADQRDWQPIETAPKNVTVLLWWRPIDGNVFAETTVIGQISSSEAGKWWNGQRGEYQHVWHVTHWMPLPNPPERSET